MQLKKAEFLKSASKLNECPKTTLNEVALLGRSNVGKSSFINHITNRKALAKTSNTPGKTRLMNYFNINDEFYIVDFPGYGYAKISKAEQERWRKEFENYLLNRENLKFVFQFIDARHDVQKNDFLMKEWLDYHSIKTYIILTKMDYIKKGDVKRVINNIENVLKTEVIPFSCKQPVNNEVYKLLEELV